MKISITKSMKSAINLLAKRQISFTSSQDGSAMVISLLVLAMVLAFVALAVSRTSNETIASSNDAAESRAFSASQASLEVMTRNFDKIFEEKLSPTAADLQHVKDLTPPGFSDYTFQQNLTQTKATETVVMTGQLLQGLNALRDEWQLDTTATEASSGVQVALRRQFYNNRVPIFQFGIFYDHNLEFHPGPRFDFGGRVHSNGSLFLMAQTGLYFSSRVSAVGQVFTDVARNGNSYTEWGENVSIKNASGTYVQLKHDMGSVLTTPSTGTPFSSDPDMPVVYKSSSWGTNKGYFQGNLLAEQNRLDLPLKIASNISGGGLDYIELIKRGKNVGDLYSDGTLKPVTAAVADTSVTTSERYYNKRGIRISIADSKAKLPGCASGTGTAAIAGKCGKRLDGDATGDSEGDFSAAGTARGYQPLTMTDGYQATRLNGNRFGTSGSNTGRQVWIKVELVGLSVVDNTITEQDVTEDFLSLGVTERAPFASSLSGYSNRDSRSVIKLQRFAMPDVQLTGADTNNYTYANIGGTNYNVVNTKSRPYTIVSTVLTPGAWTSIDNGFSDNDAHSICTTAPIIVGVQNCYAPFPIEMFDTREGLYNDSISPTSGSIYGSNVPWAGVMSMVDIDVTNLKDFLDGDYDTFTPLGTPYAVASTHKLRSSDVPSANGWVVYVSDRRGDGDFDGEYDMEDIYGNNDGILQKGEDVNNNGTLDTNYTNEAVKYTGTIGSQFESPDVAATRDHSYYRRGVRLINGQVLPGMYDSTTAANTKGFTLATENGVYVKGNYNATGIASVGTPTPSSDYLPQNTASHIPASIVADAVIILSNAWQDSRSFRYPFSKSNRNASETTVRFAMMAGDARSSLEDTPNQGGSDARLTGGVHNFKRFLEDWGGDRLNYAGSLINLYNSRNNNGAFKCCTNVYSPPNRNWVFDTTFLDPTRLPPGTPFFQDIALTGFQRVN
jgi:Tfp pilus assembly protein PilX